MIRAISFDIQALLYGPTGAELLYEMLRAEGIQVDKDALATALQGAGRPRTEAEEAEQNQRLLATILGATANHALLARLEEALQEYHAYLSMYPEVLPMLHQFRERGYTLLVTGDWMPSLGRLLREFELDGFFAIVLSAAEAGVDGADPHLLRQALDLAGVAPDEALHVGPSLTVDLPRAIGATVRPVWLNRTGIATDHDVLTITDLCGLLLLAPAVEGGAP